MKKIITILLFLPAFAFAAGVTDFITAAFRIITNTLIPLAFALCLLYFFWGVAKYIRSVGNGKEEGKRVMVWGIVALFVAFSVWGIITFMKNEIGLPPTENPQVL
jgi:predicted PurR-regulated permease PerM